MAGADVEMKTARVLLIGLTLASLMVPLAQSAYYIGLNNFIAIGTNGIINFNQNFQAYSSYPHLNLFYFTQFIWVTVILQFVAENPMFPKLFPPHTSWVK